MKIKHWIITAACLAALPSISQARDTTLYPDFATAVQEATNAGRLDGSVKFYLAGNKPAGNVKVVKSGVTTSQKTNAFNKSDEGACSWALQSALIRLQNSAKAAGANAVINLASNYKNVFVVAGQVDHRIGACCFRRVLQADQRRLQRPTASTFVAFVKGVGLLAGGHTRLHHFDVTGGLVAGQVELNAAVQAPGVGGFLHRRGEVWVQRGVTGLADAGQSGKAGGGDDPMFDFHNCLLDVITAWGWLAPGFV